MSKFSSDKALVWNCGTWLRTILPLNLFKLAARCKGWCRSQEIREKSCPCPIKGLRFP